MHLNNWAQRWGIPPQAIAELTDYLNLFPTPTHPEKSEAAIQVEVRLEGSRLGVPLWRNNVGVLRDERNIPVRFGLANDTPAMNKQIKSHDLIGIRPIIVTPTHVGSMIGQFVSREVKHGNWKYKGTEHELAQMKWAMLINNLGGDAKFVTGSGSF